MLALPWKRGFGDVITNIRDTSLSIFVKKDSRASDTKNHHLAVRASCPLTLTKCVGMPTDKNDDCIFNEPKDHTLAHVIKYIRDEKKLGHFHCYGPVKRSKDGSTKTQYIECSKRKRDGCKSRGRISWIKYQDGTMQTQAFVHNEHKCSADDDDDVRLRIPLEQDVQEKIKKTLELAPRTTAKSIIREEKISGIENKNKVSYNRLSPFFIFYGLVPFFTDVSAFAIFFENAVSEKLIQ